MAEVEIEVLHLQALEGLVAGLHQVLAVQAHLGGQLAAGAEEGLAAHRPGVARPLHLLEHLAHDAFALAAGVDLGIVEEVDAVVVRGLHELLGHGIADLLAEGEP